MDMKMYSRFFCLVILCFNLSCVLSLKCYVCDTKNKDQQDCYTIKRGSTKYLVECEAPKDMSCRFHIQYIDFVTGGTKDYDIVRQCGSSDYEPENPCFRRTGMRGRLEICTCEGDGCNTGFTTMPSISGIFGLLFLVMLFYMRKV